MSLLACGTACGSEKRQDDEKNSEGQHSVEASALLNSFSFWRFSLATTVAQQIPLLRDNLLCRLTAAAAAACACACACACYVGGARLPVGQATALVPKAFHVLSRGLREGSGEVAPERGRGERQQ